MKSRSKSKGRPNALKHGAFASEPLIEGESREDFEELHQQCVEEYKPSGRSEEEVVLTIAQYFWRKRRVGRYFAQQARRVEAHPIEDELVFVEDACNLMERLTAADAWRFIDQLPRPVCEYIREVMKPPQGDAGPDWTKQLVEHIQTFANYSLVAFARQSHSLSATGKRAAKLQELTDQRLAIDERLDQLIDKAIRRLMVLKTYKQIELSQQNTLSLPK